MRGDDEQQLGVFSYVSPEQRVPTDHPLRPLRAMADDALRELRLRFNRLYAKTGRPSIAPEKLLRALLLQVLYSVRSERMLMEQLDYNLLFRWFVGLNMDDAFWDATVFTKNRQRLLAGALRRLSSKPCSGRHASETCFRMSTSPWMALCWRHGQDRRAFAVSMTTSNRRPPEQAKARTQR
jgi:transposase